MTRIVNDLSGLNSPSKAGVWGGTGNSGALGTGSVYDPIAPYFIQQPPPYKQFSQYDQNGCTVDFFTQYFFTVAVSDPAANYQWQKLMGGVWTDIHDNDPLPGPASYSDTDSATLIISFPGCNEKGLYRAVIRNNVCAAGASSDFASFQASFSLQGQECCVNYP